MSNQFQIIERRRKVAAMLLQRKPPQHIAEQLGVSKSTIDGDIRWLRDQAAPALADWIANRLREYDTINDELLTDIDIQEMDANARLRHKAVFDVNFFRFAGGDKHDTTDASTLINTMRANADWLEKQLADTNANPDIPTQQPGHSPQHGLSDSGATEDPSAQP